jgi:hypothetical protein
MGKASNRKRDRKLAAIAATKQAIHKAQSGFVDDIVIVMQLMTAIESNDLIAFQAAVKNLEASGSDLFHFEIKLIEGDDPGTDMSLLHYATYMAADDIIAWIIRRGVNAGDAESLSELQGMMEVLNFGGDGTHDLTLYQRLILKMLRPNTVDQANEMLMDAYAAMQIAGIPKGCLTLMVQAATEFLVSQGYQPHACCNTIDTNSTTV